jgi:hypothetical protein
MNKYTYILSYCIPSESYDFEFESEFKTEEEALIRALEISSISEGTHGIAEYCTTTNERREINCSEMWLLYDMIDLKELTGTQER